MPKTICGKMEEVLLDFSDNSIDACVTDPPYSLGFMNKKWDTFKSSKAFEDWCREWAKQVFRVLKPGGHLLAFGGTRTYHRLVSGIEDAGFEIRDSIMWHYGSGFPKSVDVSKAIDKHFGAEREKIILHSSDTTFRNPKSINGGIGIEGGDRPWMIKAREMGYLIKDGDIPVSEQAKLWDGWGTALKPSTELICVARKPIVGTVVENVLKHATGALNINACRVKTNDFTEFGRWPANTVHDGSTEVLECFPDAPGQLRSVGPKNGLKSSINDYGDYGPRQQFNPRGDKGSAARFFYCAKASSSERGKENDHPTVKPIALMRWLVRLVCPVGGAVLDPFAGSFSTGIACFQEKMDYILIEMQKHTFEKASRRLEQATTSKFKSNSNTIENTRQADPSKLRGFFKVKTNE